MTHSPNRCGDSQSRKYRHNYLAKLRTRLPPAVFLECVRRCHIGQSLTTVTKWLLGVSSRGGMQTVTNYHTLYRYMQAMREEVSEAEQGTPKFNIAGVQDLVGEIGKVVKAETRRLGKLTRFSAKTHSSDKRVNASSLQNQSEKQPPHSSQWRKYYSSYLAKLATLPPGVFDECVRRFRAGEPDTTVTNWLLLVPRGGMQTVTNYHTLYRYMEAMRNAAREKEKHIPQLDAKHRKKLARTMARQALAENRRTDNFIAVHDALDGLSEHPDAQFAGSGAKPTAEPT